MSEPRYVLHKNDIPADLVFGDTLAIDSEFMGLNVTRDRLCLLQIYDGQPGSKVHIIQFAPGQYDAPNLKRLLNNAAKEKLLFFARADMKWIGHYLGVILQNVCCLRIASRIARTYTQSHDLEEVCRHMLGIRMSKEQQCTNWGQSDLTPEQLDYACNDVLHLHALREKLDAHLDQENRRPIAYGLYKCLPAVVTADLGGWGHEDIFAYHVPKP